LGQFLASHAEAQAVVGEKEVEGEDGRDVVAVLAQPLFGQHGQMPDGVDYISTRTESDVVDDGVDMDRKAEITDFGGRVEERGVFGADRHMSRFGGFCPGRLAKDGQDDLEGFFESVFAVGRDTLLDRFGLGSFDSDDDWTSSRAGHGVLRVGFGRCFPKTILD